jgi:nucleotide-binding universal stress UspA family protein
MEAMYTLLRVVEPVTAVGHDPAGFGVGAPALPSVEELQTAASRYLEGVAERLRGQGHRVQTSVVSHPLAAAALLEEAGARGPDLIALETHGRCGLARLLLGSVADKVVRGAAVPVLVHRPATA